MHILQCLHPDQVVPLWFLSEARGTTGSRKRVLPQVLTRLPRPESGGLRTWWCCLHHGFTVLVLIFRTCWTIVLVWGRRWGTHDHAHAQPTSASAHASKVGDILEQWEQRVVVVAPGDLCLDHRPGDMPHLQVHMVHIVLLAPPSRPPPGQGTPGPSSGALPRLAGRQHWRTTWSTGSGKMSPDLASFVTS